LKTPFGFSKFQRRRRLRRFTGTLKAFFTKRYFRKIHGPFWRRALFNWERALHRLLPLGGTSDGNRVEIYFDGKSTFEAMLAAIGTATQSVWIELYLFETDAAGTLLRDALIEARKRNVEVVLVYDYFGSPGLSSGFLTPLKAVGGKAYAYNPFWIWRRRGPLLYRNHRKIIAVDSRLAFCGSMNIAEEYVGMSTRPPRFRDVTMRIEGPAVKDLALLIEDSVKESAGQELSRIEKGPFYEDGVFAQVLTSNQRRSLRHIQHSLEVILERATRYCLLSTPYFLPYARLRNALISAAKRGVDVRLMTAGVSDVPLTRLAAEHIYGQFLEAGVRIYEMAKDNLHEKTVTIDGVFSMVGSFNLDQWSARRNLEVTVSAFDSHVAKQLEEHYYQSLELANEITIGRWQKRSLWQRLKAWAAYQIVRL
jgi:cardiolipin synthase